MTLFKMNAKVLLSLEKYQRNFLWEGSKQKKDHLVIRETIVRARQRNKKILDRED